jgi:hypothetical protein
MVWVGTLIVAVKEPFMKGEEGGCVCVWRRGRGGDEETMGIEGESER